MLQRRSKMEAGRSTLAHYERLLGGWRVRIRWPLVLVSVAIVPCTIPLWIYAPHGQFFAGLCIGATWGMAFWIWDDPPEYIGKWKRGADGERKTAKALRALERDGWRSFHDRADPRGNLDHILVGTAGVFLLDSKNLSGLVSFEPNGLTTRHEGAPRDDFTYTGLEGAMRGAAVRLKREVERVTRLRPWVQAVAVVWGNFPQGSAEGDRVFYVAGNRLRDWLLAQEQRLSPRNHRS
jgi:hypothetical protein